MVQQTSVSVENNFTKGLITESTGLNFPENAATDCDNCEFTIVGDVTRRAGINLEDNFNSFLILTPNRATSTYIWSNAGGDGLTKIYVRQNASLLLFYKIHTATEEFPLSTQYLTSIDASAFIASGSFFDNTLECQYSDGHGYLFVYHPSCDPFYCTYNAGAISGKAITVKIRDFSGVTETGVDVNVRPTVLTDQHNYNLLNQGWIAGNPWQAVSNSSITLGLGSKVFTVASGIVGVTLGDSVTVSYTGPSGGPGQPIIPNQGVMSGTVTAYSGTSLTINVASGATGYFGQTGTSWSISPRNTAYLTTWNSAIGNYPSNADVWWYFKNSSDAFDPATTLNNVTISAGKAPGGHFILNAFSQQRDTISSITAITDVSTNVRPKTGCWFQGRVWYAGTDAQQAATGTADYYTWTENLYFSKIVNTPADFGNCYQTNDPTSANLFDLLPTDGGVIQIQGLGSILKLFPIQNGLLVFGSNGIRLITGSQGIGFSANDFTINKVSDVKSISSTSFVNVNGLPYFWNEEGIYTVQPTKGGGLEVDPITVGTILSFYNEIPKESKRYVRGDYNPVDYIIQWAYRSTPETSIANRYLFNKILNYSTYNKAFFPYTILTEPANAPYINGVSYITYPQITTGTPEAGFKYPMSFIAAGNTFNSFADEDDKYLDWFDVTSGTSFESYFVTGYKLKGQAIHKFQPQYIQVYSRVDEADSGYKIQGIWNYAINRNSGKWSGIQKVDIPGTANYSTVFRRHKIRGSGYILQFKIISQPNKPFDIQGWAVIDNVNAGA